MAQINVFTGPMASGKTSKLLEIMHKYSNISKERVLLIGYIKDDRNKEGISTHMYGDSSCSLPLGIYVDLIRVENLTSVSKDVISKYNMIGVDEAQFFKDLKDFVFMNIENSNLKLYISGLSYDSDNKQFGQIPDLLPISTSFIKIPSICSLCPFKEMVHAGFTHSNKIKENVVCIGGLDIYQPLCLKHYMELNY